MITTLEFERPLNRQESSRIAKIFKMKVSLCELDKSQLTIFIQIDKQLIDSLASYGFIVKCVNGKRYEDTETFKTETDEVTRASTVVTRASGQESVKSKSKGVSGKIKKRNSGLAKL